MLLCETGDEVPYFKLFSSWLKAVLLYVPFNTTAGKVHWHL